MRQALDQLQALHPILSARLVGAPSGARFECGDVPAIPLTVEERVGEAGWIGVVERELGKGFDRAEGPLLRCCFLEPHTSGGLVEIVLTFHHVIIDAVSASRTIAELLESCGADAVPTAPDIGRGGLPPRADDLVPSRFRGVSGAWRSCRFVAREMVDEISYRWQTRAHRCRPPTHPGGKIARSCILPLALSEAETEALVRATRKRRLTVNSALNAAILLAVVRRRYAGTDLPHRYFAFPTLRPYLDPPVPADGDGSFLTTMRLTVRATASHSVWELAAEMQNLLHQADGSGGRFIAARFSAASMRMILGQSSYRMGTVAVSYTGAVPFGTRHGNLELTEVHGFISNLAIGPEYTVQARLFRGRLWLDILYLDLDMSAEEASAIAEEARQILVGDSAS